MCSLLIDHLVNNELLQVDNETLLCSIGIAECCNYNAGNKFLAESFTLAQDKLSLCIEF